MRNAQFEIVLQASNRGGQMTRVVTTVPLYKGVVDRIGPMVNNILPLDKEMDGAVITIRARRTDKGDVAREVEMPKGFKIETDHMAMLEDLAYQGFEAVEQFEHTMARYSVDEQVDQIVDRILQQPELAGTIEAMEVKFIQKCRNCGRYHEDEHDEDPSDMLERMPEMLKQLFGGLMEIVVHGSKKAKKTKKTGITFTVPDEMFARSPFQAMALERIKGIAIPAVKAGVVKAFDEMAATLEKKVRQLDEDKAGFEEAVTERRAQFEAGRNSQIARAVQLKELALAMEPHGFKGLKVYELQATQRPAIQLDATATGAKETGKPATDEPAVPPEALAADGSTSQPGHRGLAPRLDAGRRNHPATSPTVTSRREVHDEKARARSCYSAPSPRLQNTESSNPRKTDVAASAFSYIKI